MKNNKLNRILLLSLVVFFNSANSVHADSLDSIFNRINSQAKILVGWISTDEGWKYIKDSGNYANSEWLYIHESNRDNSSWKYFDIHGINKDQFFHQNGMIWLSQAGPDNGYYKGWWTDPENGYNYYFRESSGTMAKGRQYIGDGWVYFRDSGTQALGWQYYGGSWRYNDPLNGGIEVNKQWKWLEVSEDKYIWKYFDETGSNVDQFYRENGKSWLSLSGPSGDYYRGWWTNPENGYRYFFRKTSGSMVTGMQFIDGGWMFFRDSGTQAFQWQFINGYWRFFRVSSGTMVTGDQCIDGKWHKFGYTGIHYDSARNVSTLTGVNLSDSNSRNNKTETHRGYTSSYRSYNNTFEKLKQIRADMYDRNVPFNGSTLQEVAKQAGYNTREEYVESTTWDQSLERIALQRAVETAEHGTFNHIRANYENIGSAYTVEGVRLYSEILATTSGGFSSEMDIWSYRELDDLYKANGYGNSANGHLQIMLNPYFTHLGFAEFNSHEVPGFRGNIYIGIASYFPSPEFNTIDFEKPYGLRGTFDFEIAVKAK